MNFLDFSDKWYWIMYLISSILNIIITIFIFFISLGKDVYDREEWNTFGVFMLVISVIPFINLSVLGFYIIVIIGSILSIMMSGDN